MDVKKLRLISVIKATCLISILNRNFFIFKPLVMRLQPANEFLKKELDKISNTLQSIHIYILCEIYFL